jgi:hypothetical protein
MSKDNVVSQNTADSTKVSPDPYVSCAGLPYVGNRSFAPEEADRLWRRRRSKRRGTVLLYTLCLLLFLLPFVSYGAFYDFLKPLPTFYFLLPLFLPVVGIPPCLLCGGDFSREAKLLKKTLELQYVRVFSGSSASLDPTNWLYSRLVAKKIFAAGAEGGHTLELHPLVDEIYAVDGTRVFKAVPVVVTVATPLPEDEPVWDVPRDWMKEDATIRMERRRLSTEEIKEVVHYANALRPRLYPAFVRLLFFWVGCWGASGLLPWSRPRTFALLSLTVSLLTALRFLKRRRRAGRLAADASFGWVIIAPVPPERSGKPLPSSVECLGVSGLLWSVDGKPAAWRNTQ